MSNATSMFKAMLEDCTSALNALRHDSPDAFAAFRDAWRRTIADKPSRGARLLVPFVGAGLNHLAQGTAASWEQLVKNIASLVNQPWSDHENKVAKLLFPEKLELLLARTDKSIRSKVVELFRKMFKAKLTPSTFHGRLVNLFPLLITTNYDAILSEAVLRQSLQHKIIDATDETNPHGEAPDLHSPAILHLHGHWRPDDESEHESLIFRGVGREEFLHGPCLVLTEAQYHRLYTSNRHFQRTVQRVFGPDYLLFFMGSGMSNSEFGIHAYLRDLQLSAGHSPVGIFVNFNINGAQRALLEARGLACLSLSSAYGERHEIKVALWHALFNACASVFDTPDALLPEITLASTEIVCIGLASRNTVIAPPAAPIVESGNWVKSNRDSKTGAEDRLWDEVGGQHLFPALDMVRRGRRVALVTRVGKDPDGDWVLEETARYARACAKNEPGGDLDTQLVIRPEGRLTRRSIVVTYPLDEQTRTGTRTIYDYEGREEPGWLDPLDDNTENLVKKLLKRHANAKALYVGPFEVELSKQALEIVKPTYFFVETSSGGPPSFKKFLELIATSHEFLAQGGQRVVLASSKFVYRVLYDDNHEEGYDHGRSGVDYQRQLAQAESVVQEQILRDCAKKLFGDIRNSVLVVTLGEAGCAYFKEGTFKQIPVHSPPPPRQGIAWVGCGDLFRAAFIHRYLGTKEQEKENLDEACVAGNDAGAKRITRRLTLE